MMENKKTREVLLYIDFLKKTFQCLLIEGKGENINDSRKEN